MPDYKKLKMGICDFCDGFIQKGKKTIKEDNKEYEVDCYYCIKCGQIWEETVWDCGMIEYDRQTPSEYKEHNQDETLGYLNNL